MDSEILGNEADFAELTPRQRDILARLAQGKSNGAIARELHIEEKTVENQMSGLYRRLGITVGNSEVHARVKAALLYHQAYPPVDVARALLRTLADRLNNSLHLTIGYLDLLKEHADLSAEHCEWTLCALRAAEAAAADLARFQQIRQIVWRPTYAGPALDLERSIAGS